MAAARVGSKRSPATRGLCYRRKAGYGRTCTLWVDAAQFAISVIVFTVGDGADRGDPIGEIARSALGDTHDFVLARSTCGEWELRAMSWTVGFGIGVRHGKPYCDTCAIRRGALRTPRNDLRLEQ